jgi:hypothetical protein
MYIRSMYPLIIALCLLPFFAHSQKINRKEVREFMNQYLTEKYPRDGDTSEPIIYMKRKPSMENVLSLAYTTQTDTIEDWVIVEPNFTVEDSIDIAASLKYAGRYRFSKRDWQNGRLRTFSKMKRYFKRQVTGERNYIVVLKSTKTQYHYRYASTPVFYRNYSKAIFYRGYTCGGLCGSAGVCMYERVNGLWKMEKELLRIMY